MFTFKTYTATFTNANGETSTVNIDAVSIEVAKGHAERHAYGFKLTLTGVVLN